MNTNRIRGLMAERRITQQEVSTRLGISSNTFRNKLSGKTDFKIAELKTLADFLDVDVSIFLQ